jgi:hypothetical protein
MTLFDDGLPCDHPKAEPQRLIAANGATHVVMICVDCDHNINPGRFHPHDRIYGSLDDLPIWRDYRGQNPPCAHCGAAESELHHWYPRELDGPEEADRWPTAWLCTRCHNLWHVKIARLHMRGQRP